MSNSVRPHRWQPTRFCHPWDSPGKNTGVGCHFLLQRMKVKSLSRVRLFATPRTAAHPPGSSIHGIFQARVLEWGAIAFFITSGSVVKNSSVNAGDSGLIPGLERSPGEGNGNPLQYSYLGNPWTEEPGRLQSTRSQESDLT